MNRRIVNVRPTRLRDSVTQRCGGSKGSLQYARVYLVRKVGVLRRERPIDDVRRIREVVVPNLPVLKRFNVIVVPKSCIDGAGLVPGCVGAVEVPQAEVHADPVQLKLLIYPRELRPTWYLGCCVSKEGAQCEGAAGVEPGVAEIVGNGPSLCSSSIESSLNCDCRISIASVSDSSCSATGSESSSESSPRDSASLGSPSTTGIATSPVPSVSHSIRNVLCDLEPTKQFQNARPKNFGPAGGRAWRPGCAAETEPEPEPRSGEVILAPPPRACGALDQNYFPPWRCARYSNLLGRRPRTSRTRPRGWSPVAPGLPPPIRGGPLRLATREW